MAYELGKYNNILSKYRGFSVAADRPGGLVAAALAHNIPLIASGLPTWIISDYHKVEPEKTNCTSVNGVYRCLSADPASRYEAWERRRWVTACKRPDG